MEKYKNIKEWVFREESNSVISCTPNHKFLTKNGTYKEAKDLFLDDEIYSVKKSAILSNIQKQIMIGMYLGDSYLSMNNNSSNCSFRVKPQKKNILIILLIY